MQRGVDVLQRLVVAVGGEQVLARSLVPIDRKSATPMKPGNAIAAAGTSIIAPSGSCSAVRWPSARRSGDHALEQRAHRDHFLAAAVTIGTSTRTGP